MHVKQKKKKKKKTQKGKLQLSRSREGVDANGAETRWLGRRANSTRSLCLSDGSRWRAELGCSAAQSGKRPLLPF